MRRTNQHLDLHQSKLFNTPVKRAISPCRQGGKGAQMLTRALSQQNEDHCKWVLHTGAQACFAKYLGSPASDVDSIMIQPMYPSTVDKTLLTLAQNGHIIFANKENLIEVKVWFEFSVIIQ